MDSFPVICIAGYIIFILISKLKEKTDELKNKVSPPYSDDFWKYYDILYPDDRFHDDHDNLETFCRSLMSDRIHCIREEYFRKYIDLQNEYLAKEEEFSFPDVDISGYFHWKHYKLRCEDYRDFHFYTCYLDGYVYSLKDKSFILSPFSFNSLADLHFLRYCFSSGYLTNTEIIIPDEYTNTLSEGQHIKIICSRYENSYPLYLQLVIEKIID